MQTLRVNAKAGTYTLWRQGSAIGALLHAGKTAPTAGAKGYSPGSLFLKTNGSTDTAWLVNIGSKTSCNFLPYKNGLGSLLATAAEINNIADVSNRLVSGATALTVATHSDRIILLSGTQAVTLPAATGSGAVFNFLTSGTIVSASITRAGSDAIKGTVYMCNTVDSSVVGYTTASGASITLDGHTQGGYAKGDAIRVVDTASAVWTITARLTCDDVGTTPFA